MVGMAASQTSVVWQAPLLVSGSYLFISGFLLAFFFIPLELCCWHFLCTLLFEAMQESFLLDLLLISGFLPRPLAWQRFFLLIVWPAPIHLHSVDSASCLIYSWQHNKKCCCQIFKFYSHHVIVCTM